MTVQEETIARLRRMVNESSSTPYTDEILTSYIEEHPLMDSNGHEKYDEDGELDTDWIEAYDLHAAAGQIWEEKAAAVQMYYDFIADGGQFSQSRLYDTAMEQARYHFARRKPQSKATHKKPNEDDSAIAYAWWRGI